MSSQLTAVLLLVPLSQSSLVLKLLVLSLPLVLYRVLVLL